ncbi:hypothetical protein HOV93_09300 [Planctomycetes bacterium FF15]|uniref:Uncharacterized protein n=1 Tax=Bremerella alba TaxID=980252 RepID=A0A7V8V2J9_9BACT|nr:hypothetical protein [Bremerella alba]
MARSTLVDSQGDQAPGGKVLSIELKGEAQEEGTFNLANGKVFPIECPLRGIQTCGFF